MTESNTYNGPAHDGHAHDSNAIDEASGTGTTESTTETTTRYTTPSEKDSGEKPDEKIKLSEVAENMYADTEDGKPLCQTKSIAVALEQLFLF